jgi:hypothetical protein
MPHSDTGERVTPVLDFPSRDGLVVNAIRVDYEPAGFTRGTHRHPAGAYVYVIDGSVIFGLDDREPVVLKAGESFSHGHRSRRPKVHPACGHANPARCLPGRLQARLATCAVRLADASTPRQRNPRCMTYVTPPRPHPADAPTPGLVMGQ